MINKSRLLQTLCELIEIDSPSGDEAAVALKLKGIMIGLGVDADLDSYGNLIGRFGYGNPILLSAHMDTVEPGRGIKPKVDGDRVISGDTTILGGDDPDYSGDEHYLDYITNSADPEIEAMYSSFGESPLWKDALSYRRVMGFDFSTVYKNLAIQGEYGEIFNDSKMKFGRGPSAFVINSYLQFDNLSNQLLAECSSHPTLAFVYF